MTLFRRLVGVPVALFVALLAQLVLVNRAPLPGGVAPDLVLLVVAATGATTGPLTGLLAGFFGGLALDVAPPGGHLAGEFALIFCLVGYGCGRLRGFTDPMEEHATITSVALTAMGAAVGEAAKAGLGLMVSDPDVTAPVVQRLLPGAVLYDLLLSPFVLWALVAVITFSLHPRVANEHQMPPRTATEYGAVRVATAGSAPRLRLSGSPSAMTPAPSMVRKDPRLRLAGSTSPALSGTHRGISSPSGRKPVAVNFSGSGMLGSNLLGVGGLGGGAVGPSLFSGSRLRRSGPGKGWLTGSGSGFAAPTAASRKNGPGKGWLSNSGPGRAPAPKISTPGRGWLRSGSLAPTTRRRATPGKGWLSAGKPRNSRGMGRSGKPKTPDFKRSSTGLSRKGLKRSSPGRGWLKGSGAGRSRVVYRGSGSAMPAGGFRRRRRLRIGGRG